MCVPDNSLYPISRFYYYPHFVDGEMETERLRDLPKVSQLVSGRAGIQI